MSLNLPIYVVNYKNDERKQRMIDRFATFGLVPHFVPGVDDEDPRLSVAPDTCKKIWGIMLQHMDSIRDFYENLDAGNHCIVCEDDVYISKNFVDDVNHVLPLFDQMQLDILMLGYLLPFKIEMSTCLHREHFAMIGRTDTHSLHKYPSDIWGTQMYLISRKYAKFLLEKYTVDFALTNINTVTYSSDWVITKNGNRALVSPMIAVEEGVNTSGHGGQVYYHVVCSSVHYDKNKYI
jgi:hypothetical protein